MIVQSAGIVTFDPIGGMILFSHWLELLHNLAKVYFVVVKYCEDDGIGIGIGYGITGSYKHFPNFPIQGSALILRVLSIYFPFPLIQTNK
jgi:hypothetical protein